MVFQAESVEVFLKSVKKECNGMNREILRLAIPNILSNISVPLLSSVDTALMGHISASNLAALGISGMVFMFLYSSFGFLRMGTTGMAAQAYGAGSGRELSLILWRAFIFAAGIALLLLILKNIIFDISAFLMNMDSSYIDLAREYFMIRILTAPAVFGLYVTAGFFFGLQNARYPLYITLLVNFVNIFASVFMVRFMGWGIAGAAWGTVFAQYAGLSLGILLLLRYREYLTPPKNLYFQCWLIHFKKENTILYILHMDNLNLME
jgi:MATE family multidrug resistance protein